MQTEKSGYVYFIRCDGYTKIGYARSPKKRLADIKTANPHPVKLIGAIYSDDVERLEHKVQTEASDYHKNGEWYEISVDWVKWVISREGGVISDDGKDIPKYNLEPGQYTHLLQGNA